MADTQLIEVQIELKKVKDLLETMQSEINASEDGLADDEMGDAEALETTIAALALWNGSARQILGGAIDRLNALSKREGELGNG